MAAPEWRILLQLLKQIAIPRGRQATGLFSLEGYRSMERALRNDAPIQEVLVSQKFARAETAREIAIMTDVAKQGIPLRIAPDRDFAELNAGRGIGEVFAVMPVPSTPDWSAFVRPQGRSLLMVGWNLGDPGNTGAVIRSALASGCSGFLAVGTTDPWHPKSVRTSMGSLFALPILKVMDGQDWISELHARDFETVATVCRDAVPLPDLKLNGLRSALVMGSEAFGLADAVAARMKQRVTIPMPAGVDSYSINAAAAVLAYTIMMADE